MIKKLLLLSEDMFLELKRLQAQRKEKTSINSLIRKAVKQYLAKNLKR